LTIEQVCCLSGFLLILAGVALYSVPAALIVAGLGLVGASLVDTGSDS